MLKKSDIPHFHPEPNAVVMQLSITEMITRSAAWKWLSSFSFGDCKGR